MKITISCILAGLALRWVATARADDATLELESPLTDSGIALSASSNSTDLTIAFEQAIPGSLYWSARLQGAAGDDHTAALGSQASGIADGVAARFGFGWKGALGSSAEYQGDCTQVQARTCRQVILSWRGHGGGAGVIGAYADHLCDTWSNATSIDAAQVPDETDQQALSKVIGDHMATSCEDLRKDPRFAPVVRETLDHDSRPIASFGASVTANVSQVSFHPIDATGTPDLSRTESWKKPLASFGLDGAIQKNTAGAGLRLALGKSYEPHPVEVCETTVQGNFSVRDCSNGVLGEPKPAWAMSGSLSLVKNPIKANWKIGDLRAGAQLTLELATSGAKLGDLASSGSYSYRINLPVFVAKYKAPWGVRAGFAAEWSGAVGDPDPTSDDDDLRVVAFLATANPL